MCIKISFKSEKKKNSPFVSNRKKKENIFVFCFKSEEKEKLFYFLFFILKKFLFANNQYTHVCTKPGDVPYENFSK